MSVTVETCSCPPTKFIADGNATSSIGAQFELLKIGPPVVRITAWDYGKANEKSPHSFIHKSDIREVIVELEKIAEWMDV